MTVRCFRGIGLRMCGPDARDFELNLSVQRAILREIQREICFTIFSIQKWTVRFQRTISESIELRRSGWTGTQELIQNDFQNEID